MKALGLVVPRLKGEPLRKKLLDLGALDRRLEIRAEAHNLILPLLRPVELGYEMRRVEFKELPGPPPDYRTLVKVPEKLRSELPSSFDMLGQIAILKLAPSLERYGKAIGKAILRTHTSLRTICVDRGVRGPRRLRELTVVAGERNMATVYREHGLTYELDVAKVFFSPRLATERLRVATQVGRGELVLDMFCGAGPFAMLIAKRSAPERVYALDMNPDAIEALKHNLALNHLTTVEPQVGDVRELVPQLPKVDRIIMNLPKDAFEYFPLALGSLKPLGHLHYYEILERTEVAAREGALQSAAEAGGAELEVVARRPVKSYSPTMDLFGFDLLVKRRGR